MCFFFRPISRSNITSYLDDIPDDNNTGGSPLPSINSIQAQDYDQDGSDKEWNQYDMDFNFIMNLK